MAQTPPDKAKPTAPTTGPTTVPTTAPTAPTPTASVPLQITTSGDWTVLCLQEASMMDVQMIEALHAQVRKIVADGRNRLILDFKKVQYISSSMVGVLVAIRQEIVKGGGGGGGKGSGDLILVSLNDRLIELLRLTRLESMFVVEPDSKTALKKVGTK